MALDYTIDPARRLVTITGEYGDDRDWRALLSAIARDPALPPGCGFLRDLRHAKHPVDGATIMRIVAVVREFWQQLGASRAAMVTPRHLDVAALMAHAIADEQQLPLRAFTSYEAAVEWLEHG